MKINTLIAKEVDKTQKKVNNTAKSVKKLKIGQLAIFNFKFMCVESIENFL